MLAGLLGLLLAGAETGWLFHEKADPMTDKRFYGLALPRPPRRKRKGVT